MKISVNNVMHNVYVNSSCGLVYVDLLNQRAISAESLFALVERLIGYGFKVRVY